MDINPDIEARLLEAAKHEGIPVSTLIERMFDDYGSAHRSDEPTDVLTDPTLDWINSRLASAPTDPAKIREAEEDLNETMRNMNANRIATGERVPFPEIR